MRVALVSLIFALGTNVRAADGVIDIQHANLESYSVEYPACYKNELGYNSAAAVFVVKLSGGRILRVSGHQLIYSNPNSMTCDHLRASLRAGYMNSSYQELAGAFESILKNETVFTQRGNCAKVELRMFGSGIEKNPIEIDVAASVIRNIPATCP